MTSIRDAGGSALHRVGTGQRVFRSRAIGSIRTSISRPLFSGCLIPITEDLDAGPIIEQDVRRIDHRHDPDDLRRMGRYIERVVLARAVGWHVEDRVLLHGNKTIIFN